jgi:hypothetical protein
MVKWREDDVIRFVEQRIRAFEVANEQRKQGLSPDKPDHPLSEMDLRIWLATVKRGGKRKSLTDLAKEMHPRIWKKGTGKRGNQRAISLIRNSIRRVEKFLNRKGEGFAFPKAWQRDIARAKEILRLG